MHRLVEGLVGLHFEKVLKKDYKRDETEKWTEKVEKVESVGDLVNEKKTEKDRDFVDRKLSTERKEKKE